MAHNIAQVVSKVNNSSASATFDSDNVTTSAGSLLILYVGLRTGGSQSVSSVTDDAGNTWTFVVEAHTGGQNNRVELWYCKNALALTAQKIHVNMTVGLIAAMYVYEDTGGDKTSPLVSSAVANNAASSALSVGPVTPGAASDMQTVGIHCPIVQTGLGAFTTGPTNNQTWIDSSVVANHDDVLVAQENPGTTAAQTYTDTLGTSGPWAAIIATWKAAPLVAAASGGSTSAGSADIRLLMQAGASGGSSSSGSAGVSLLMAAGASGGSSSSGSAAISLLLAIAASGGSSSAGSAAVALLMAIAASGPSTSAGAAAISLLLAIRAAGGSTSSGSAAIILITPTALRDYEISKRRQVFGGPTEVEGR